MESPYRAVFGPVTRLPWANGSLFVWTTSCMIVSPGTFQLVDCSRRRRHPLSGAGSLCPSHSPLEVSFALILVSNRPGPVDSDRGERAPASGLFRWLWQRGGGGALALGSCSENRWQLRN